MKHSELPILDAELFSVFCELMGDIAPSVLTQHLSVADGYIQTIYGAFEQEDLKRISEAAHPLKSSSQQIGALKIAALAMELEGFSGDIAQIKSLIEQAEQAHNEACLTIKEQLKKMEKTP